MNFRRLIKLHILRPINSMKWICSRMGARINWASCRYKYKKLSIWAGRKLMHRNQDHRNQIHTLITDTFCLNFMGKKKEMHVTKTNKWWRVQF